MGGEISYQEARESEGKRVQLIEELEFQGVVVILMSENSLFGIWHSVSTSGISPLDTSGPRRYLIGGIGKYSTDFKPY